MQPPKALVVLSLFINFLNIVSATKQCKSFPSIPILTLGLSIGTYPDSDIFWNSMTYWLSQYPTLSRLGISAYGNIYPNIT
jgi:hypothetical protein